MASFFAELQWPAFETKGLVTDRSTSKPFFHVREKLFYCVFMKHFSFMKLTKILVA